LKEKITSWLLLVALKNYGNKSNLKAQQEKRLESLRKEFALQNREKEILSYLLLNYKNTGIAEKLFISVNTVKKHIERICIKTGVSGKQELLDLMRHYVYK